MRHFKTHGVAILEAHDRGSTPLDLIISRYYKERKFLGSRDRRAIGEGVYGVIRWQGLLDHLQETQSWESRWDLFHEIDPRDRSKDKSLPLHIRCSFPESVFKRLAQHYGEEKAFNICIATNGQAPTTVRVNTLKTTREELLKRWKGLAARPCELSDLGITFPRRVPLMASPEAKEGLFELQDEASQLVSQLVAAEPGDEVLDFCAGSGGKALAIACKMHNKGQLHLHDVREKILWQAKKRLRIAGVQNCQTVLAGDKRMRQLRSRMDWVLVDAPCSGSGTWRRSPAMKWRFELEDLERYVAQQRDIITEAIKYLKPGGKLVYVTCSLFPEENEEQLAFLTEELGMKLVGEPFQSVPKSGEMDGFYAVVLGV